MDHPGKTGIYMELVFCESSRPKTENQLHIDTRFSGVRWTGGVYISIAVRLCRRYVVNVDVPGTRTCVYIILRCTLVTLDYGVHADCHLHD